jgi:hypothetical protein
MTERELRAVLPTLAALDEASACQLLCACLIDFLLDEGYDDLADALIASVARTMPISPPPRAEQAANSTD